MNGELACALAAVGTTYLTSDCRHEAHKLARDRGADHGLQLSRPGKPAIAPAQPLLRLPCDVADRFGASCCSNCSRLMRAGKRYDQAASISIRRAVVLPALVIPPCRRVPPLESVEAAQERRRPRTSGRPASVGATAADALPCAGGRDCGGRRVRDFSILAHFAKASLQARFRHANHDGILVHIESHMCDSLPHDPSPYALRLCSGLSGTTLVTCIP
jgi:hypothetical protein